MSQLPQGLSTTLYLDCQGDGAKAFPAAGVTGIEESLLIPHEGWFEHIATAAILAEESITQVHLHASCLEVQGHWKEVAGKKVQSSLEISHSALSWKLACPHSQRDVALHRGIRY